MSPRKSSPRMWIGVSASIMEQGAENDVKQQEMAIISNARFRMDDNVHALID